MVYEVVLWASIYEETAPSKLVFKKKMEEVRIVTVDKMTAVELSKQQEDFLKKVQTEVDSLNKVDVGSGQTTGSNNYMIHEYDLNIKRIASSIRKIVAMKGFQEEPIDFIKSLNTPKFYYHPAPSKITYTYFAESGFTDIPSLKDNYIDFLQAIGKDIQANIAGSFKNIESYIKVDTVQGELATNFSFIFNDIRWEIYNKIVN